MFSFSSKIIPFGFAFAISVFHTYVANDIVALV